MKKAIGLLAVIVLFVMSSATASAQMKFGVQGGANFSTMKIKSISTSNAAGWYLGPTLEMLLPVVGLGVEGSFWYSRVNTEAKVLGVKKDMHFNYFTIPVNLKYKIQIPMFSPFAFVGPEFQLKLKDNLDRKSVV